MKLHKHLAIYIFLGLNAVAGWHDSAPFVAWPATNHLRWVDNVDVYTNASHWTNANYGAWTNNYNITSNWWVDPTLGISNFIAPFFLKSRLNTRSGIQTNAMLNAKDARTYDCTRAIYERYLALSSANTFSNFYTKIYSTLEQRRPWIYRNETANIQDIKSVIYDIYTNFGNVTYTSGVPYFQAWTITNLCTASSVPTNFFDYTPSRSSDGSWSHYQRILTNTFILRQGTNATHVATNSLVDSAGISFTAIGTNGTQVTRYATNLNQMAGYDLGVYGWDGLRRVITNLYATESTPQWGIGVSTNYNEKYTNNFTYQALGSFASGSSGSPPVRATTISDCVAVNTNLPYGYLVGQIPWDKWDWSLSSVLTNPSVLAVTNSQAGFKTYASYAFEQYLYGRHFADCENVDPYNLTTTNWQADIDTRNHYRGYSNKVELIASPLWIDQVSNIAPRTVLMTASTNSSKFLAYSNYISASVGAVTSTPVSISYPVPEFGFTNYSGFAFGGDGWDFSRVGSKWELSSFWRAEGITIGSNPQTNTVMNDTLRQTNLVTAGTAITIWNFEYK